MMMTTTSARVVVRGLVGLFAARAALDLRLFWKYEGCELYVRFVAKGNIIRISTINQRISS